MRRAYHRGEAIPLSVWSLCNFIYTTLAPLQSKNSDSLDSEKEDVQEHLLAHQEQGEGFKPPHICENLDIGSLRKSPLLLPGSNLRVALTPLQLSLFLFLQYLSRLLMA